MTVNPGLVDVHAHYLPHTLRGALQRRTDFPRIVQSPDRAAIEYGGGYVERLLPEMGDSDQLLASMDHHGIEVSVLSINQPGVIGLPPGEAAEVAKDANDELVDLVRTRPTRLAGMATLPLQAPDEAAAELERAVGAGLRGAMIVSNVSGTSLDEMNFKALFDAAERMDVPLFMHPILPLSAATVDKYGLTVALGFLFDTTTAAVRLVLGGLYERHPRLKFFLAHAGSLLPQVAGRIDYEAERNPTVQGTLSVLPSEHLKLMYTDTVCGYSNALTSALALFGDGQVMFGTDYPFWEPEKSTTPMRRLEEDGELPAGVQRENARHLFGLELRQPRA